MLNLWKKYKKKDNNKGFTLIELLIVLIVISILMAIIIPNISGQKAKIEEQSRINIAEIIDTQVNTYQLVEGQSEVTVNDLTNKGYITDKQAQQADKLLGLKDGTVITLPITIPDN